MNKLDFPIRIYERSEDDLVIMIPHDPVNDYFDEVQKKAKTDHTRQFVNWLRKQFPDVLTEFKYLNKRLGAAKNRNWYGYCCRPMVNCDRHFVAYGISKQQMLLIKLSWQFQTEMAYLESNKGGYAISIEPSPSPELLKRIEDKKRTKLLKTGDA